MLGIAEMGDVAMIRLHPRMKVKTAAYFLHLSGYRLRWNVKNRALEVVEL